MTEPRTGNPPLRVAIIGTGRRSGYLYGPLLQALDDTELVAVWGRSADSAAGLGARLGVPAYTDLERLLRETAAEVGVVSVNYAANGQVGRQAVEHGLHVLLETPIAHQLSEADAIIETARQRGLKVEVAEQFHRRPLEQAKLALIGSGLMGRVHTSFNDFCGHGYHGVSVMRSYLGFDCRPLQVTGAVRRYALQTGGNGETQEHGIVEFEGGGLGIFHWSNVAYGSPLRWWRSSRFLAQRGMGISVGVGLDIEERLSLLAPGDGAPQFLTVERRWERVDGGALTAIEIHTGRPEQPLIRWRNPFAPRLQGDGRQWHDDEIGVAGCIASLVRAVREDAEPSYGAQQGRLDQELICALRKSSAEGGVPVRLPLDPDEVIPA